MELLKGGRQELLKERGKRDRTWGKEGNLKREGAFRHAPARRLRKACKRGKRSAVKGKKKARAFLRGAGEEFAPIERPNIERGKGKREKEKRQVSPSGKMPRKKIAVSRGEEIWRWFRREKET